MPHRPLGGINTFGPHWYEGSQTFCSLQNECYFFVMLEEMWEKIFFCTFTHCASHFQNLLCTCLKNMKKKNSVYSASYRNKEGFFYNFTVCKCTDRNERMGREAEGKGGGDGWRMEKGRGEEKRGEEERREDCFIFMRTVQNEKLGELATS